MALQNGSQQDAVQDALQSLGGSSRQLSAPTDGSELFGCEPMCTKGFAPAEPAAATASAIARLMPTPPTGDIACAASPMQSTPLACQRRKRSSRTSRTLTSSQDVMASDDDSGISSASSR